MAEKVGVITMAEVNTGPSASGPGFVDLTSPSFWSAFWAVLALAWLVYVFGRAN